MRYYQFDESAKVVASYAAPQDGIDLVLLPDGGEVGSAWQDGVWIAPEGPYRLYKSIFIRRMSEQEAATMEAVLKNADAKLRLMFNSVEYFVSDDPLFATMKAAVAQALGSARAEELLASE